MSIEPRVRFKTLHAIPPGDWYEYAIGEEVVRSRSRIQICGQVRELRKKHGLTTIGDGFAYVMEYMCPRLPDGFCSKPSTIAYVRATTVKENTVPYFRARMDTSDVIEKRLAVCLECPSHLTRGFCMDCTGFLDWMYKGFGNRRGRLPPDNATGVCICEMAFSAAVASSSDMPLKPNTVYPEKCWRTEAQGTGGSNGTA